MFPGLLQPRTSHQGVGGALAEPEFGDVSRNVGSIDAYRWKSCCRGLYQLPIAAVIAIRTAHVYIRRRTPHLNGKVERSHRIDVQEFYQLHDRNGISDDIHLFNVKLRTWEDYYNYHRPHGALQDQTPFERLIEKTRADVSRWS